MDIRLFIAFVVAVVFLEEGSAVGSEVFIRIDPTNDFEWIQFKQTHNKTYMDPLEEAVRRRNWEYNVKFVNRHNEEFLRGDHSFWVRIQSHSDMSQTEVINTMTGLIPPKDGEEVYPPALTEPNLSLPSTVDWRNQEGFVSRVQNQGKCGSCWTFSAAGAFEGQCRTPFGDIPSVSEQNLLDCAKQKYSNFGCKGGWMNNAFRYIRDNGGVAHWACYIYIAMEQPICLYQMIIQASQDKCKLNCTVERYENIANSERSLQDAVANIGPMAIGVDVDSKQFSHYGGGVFDNPSCRKSSPNHAMTNIGYGHEGGKDYWLVKNSWGTGWGEQGYIKMRRNASNQCGIANYASYPVVRHI